MTTDLFEEISEEEFAAEQAVGVDVFDNTVDTGRPTSSTPTDLVYCNFCKGYYNEYHFGDIDEPSR
jgi:hypothetical protein